MLLEKQLWLTWADSSQWESFVVLMDCESPKPGQ